MKRAKAALEELAAVCPTVNGLARGWADE